MGPGADLVLLDANPLIQIGNTRLIDSVILRGRLLSADDRRAMLDAIARTNR
jgi:hypothetical protein